MAISLKHLRLVREVVRLGSMTKAAKSLFLTQSALSHQLAELERLAGAPVFVRAGKRMVPTPVGVRILDSAEQTLAELQTLDADLKRLASGKAGILRLTTQCYTSYHWLPQLVPSFRKRYPNVQVDLVPTESADITDAMHSGKVDLALCYDPPSLQHVHTIPLFVDDVVLIVHPDHELTKRAFVNADDFRELDLLVYLDRPHDSMLYQHVLRPAGVVPHRVSEIRLTEGIVALVEAGMGCSAVTRWSVAPALRQGRVSAVKITEFGLRREWVAAYIPQPGQAHLEHFVSLMREGPRALFSGRSASKDLPFAAIKDMA